MDLSLRLFRVWINNQKKASENALLIDELNSLRREKRTLEIKVNPKP